MQISLVRRWAALTNGRESGRREQVLIVGKQARKAPRQENFKTFFFTLQARVAESE